MSAATWWFGGFDNGSIDQVIWTGAWNPTSLVTVEFTGERNMARLPAGDFNKTLVGNRVRLNLSPDLSVASYVQYDTISQSLGVNSRLRWTFRPEADVFIVYYHNVRSILDRWQLDSNQFVMKVQYAWRRCACGPPERPDPLSWANCPDRGKVPGQTGVLLDMLSVAGRTR